MVNIFPSATPTLPNEGKNKKIKQKTKIFCSFEVEQKKTYFNHWKGEECSESFIFYRTMFNCFLVENFSSCFKGCSWKKTVNLHPDSTTKRVEVKEKNNWLEFAIQRNKMWKLLKLRLY